jgi:hypothetical protein
MSPLTCAEQGEDMQGYVTELILTLEAVVETLDSGQYIHCTLSRKARFLSSSAVNST